MTAILSAALAIATASGASGVFSLPTPAATPEGKARIGFGMDFWRGGDFLLPGATSQRTGAALSGSLGFLGFVEAFGALGYRSTNLSFEASRRSLTSFGDADLGVKLLVPGAGPVAAGLLLQLDVPSGVGGFSLKGSGGRAAALFGYTARRLAVSAIAGYRVDNSGRLVNGTPATLPAFALGLSSYDTAYGGATLQVPFEYASPALELSFESPVARRAALPIGERPLRSRLALGVAQVHSDRLPALSLDAAVQLSLSRAGRMSEVELPAPGFSPDPPWTVLAMVSWAFDRPSMPHRPRELEWHGEAGAKQPTPVVVRPKPKGVLRALVIDASTKLPIAGAWVSLVEGGDAGATTGPEGHARLEADAGAYTMAVAHDGYDLLTEPVAVPALEEVSVAVQLQPSAPDAQVRGRLVGEDGAALRASVVLSKPGTLPTLPAEPQTFEKEYALALQHGSYELNAVAPGYRSTPIQVEVRPGETVTRDLELRRIAGEPRARVVAEGVEISQPISFSGATPDAASIAALAEIAAVLKSQRAPLEVVARVAAPGPSDEAEAMQQAEARARAVIEVLKARGVRTELIPRPAGVARPGQPLLELRFQPLQLHPRSVLGTVTPTLARATKVVVPVTLGGAHP